MISESSIQSTFESLASAVKDSLTRPVYLRIAKGPRGEISVQQITFLTVDQLAELAHVERRTVYSWVERAQRMRLKFYRPPGSRGILFELNEILDWLKGNAHE
jgi:excisionase family DNA binding protein